MPLAARRRRAALPLTLLLALALLPSGCDSSCSFEPVGCYKDQGSPRTLRWHLDGCPIPASDLGAFGAGFGLALGELSG